MAEDFTIEAVPVAPLKLAAHVSAEKLAQEVDAALVEYRKHDFEQLKEKYTDFTLLRDFAPDSFLLDLSCPRFGTGEGKGVINESCRGVDEFILCDITNYSNTYTVSGFTNHMSPDDNYQDLKRIIGASVAKAHRVNVIMPFLYESRQHKRQKRESLDCAMALEELVNMGVKNIITFDAHDPRVQNAIPLNGFDSFMPTYSFVKCILKKFPDLKITKDTLMVISPDEGAMGRAVFLANNLGVDMGMFYKRRDYSKVVGGRNPIVAHEFLGSSVEGKTVIIVDDMISSGESMLDTARELKERKAKNVIVCCTFGLFTNGFAKFDEAYSNEYIDLIVTANLNYKPAEIYEKPWYMEANLSRYLAAIINSFNYDMSTRSFGNSDKIQKVLNVHNAKFM
ncbi:MAG: ribose-phosphate pyrophosphokinase [Lachnospiraceae bacterium]|nr:ribose-phosphate pyrophosphokinase [Lachnospiraceae bacterium]